MNTIVHALVKVSFRNLFWLGVFCLCAAFSAQGQQGHFLVAHYTFDDSNNLGNDVSTNNNSFNAGSGWANSSQVQFSANSIAGGGSAEFDGGESMVPSMGTQPFDNWMAMFYGSFSVSLWLNTANVAGNDSDSSGCCGDPVVIWAYNNSSGVNPIMITGTKAAFFTSDPNGNGDMLHSTNDITTGQWVHVVVTRNQITGEKDIYINGVLDSSDIASTNALIGNTQYYDLGGIDAANSAYVGLVDDLQMYDGVLSPTDVAYLYANPGQAAANVPISTGGLVAHYDFNEGNSLAADLSANGNNLINDGKFGGPLMSTNATLGFGTVYFNGGSFLTASSNLVPTMAGNFSLSLWIASTQSLGYDGEPAYQGAGIFAADDPGSTNDIIPMALDGGLIGFNTGSPANDDTLNTTIDINDGNYHHVVVTRNQATGEKQIYIDGSLNTSEVGNTLLLNAPNTVTIGALSDASQTDPSYPIYYGYNGFVGYLGDIQMYSRVISASEVSYLDTNPGQGLSSGMVVHYDFDEGTTLAPDVSGHGNDIEYAGNFYYNAPAPQFTNDPVNGDGVVNFDGNSYLVPQGDLPAVLAGNFSLSVWLQTTQNFDFQGDYAYNGAGVITAEVPYQYDDLIPVAMTGGYPAFETDASEETVLTGTSPINDGNFHQIVVTRNQASGQMQMYVDGALNNTATDDGSILNNPQMVIFGALADASQSDPQSPTTTGTNGYVGYMGDFQLYSRVISAGEVSFLYNNYGVALPAGGIGNSNNDAALAAALGAPNLPWTTSGDAAWFPEATNTYSTNTQAAQSGSLQDDQSSVLQTTVTGPGTITFFWQTAAVNGDDFDLEFDIDGNYYDDISGQTSWTPDNFDIPDSGAHTLTWNANTLGNYGSSPADAGYLDEVVFTPAVAPVITVNPFSQTNYPGYTVALLAAATGTPEPTWQWYEGNNPIPNATSALFIPSGSGTGNVAGTYYAVASNIAGSQPTSTATVTFMNAPLPPDWSKGLKSPFVNSDQTDSYVANDVYYACLVDTTGTNIYCAGYTSGTNYFGSTLIRTTTNQESAVIIKETSAGAGLWIMAVTNNGNGTSYCENIAPAPNGGLYADVYFSGTNWIGNTLLQDSGQGSIYLVRLDTNGNKVWSQTITGSNGLFSPLLNISSDSSGNVTFAAVASGGSVSIGGTNITVTNQTSILAQFNSNGALNWVEPLANIVEGVQANNGRLYITLLNWLSGNTNYTVGGLINDKALNYSVAALTSTNGQGIWLRDVGGVYGVENPAYLIDDIPLLAVSGSNLFIAGTAYGTNATFGSYDVPIANNRGQYFARYDTNGNAELATGFGSSTTQPEAITADASGNVYVVGNFDTYSYFGEGLIAAPHVGELGNGYYSQGFAAEFDRDGDPLWARTAITTNLTIIPDTDYVTLWDLSLSPSGLWVAGEGVGSVFFGTNLVNSTRIFIELGQSTFVDFYQSGILGMINLNEAPVPVTLLNPNLTDASFQFSFISTANHTNYVELSTNLASGIWTTNQAIAGDGTLKFVTVPANTHMAEFFRVATQ